MKKTIILVSIILASLQGCQMLENYEVLTQVKTYESLMKGDYKGVMPYQTVTQFGDFGIGSFSDLNGEMVMLDGIVYRATASGDIEEAHVKELASVATVCHFRADEQIKLSGGFNLQELNDTIQKSLAHPESFYAIKVEATFGKLTTRSIAAQAKPYRPLTEVLQNEVIMQSSNIQGSFVGFKAPEEVQGAVWDGFHFHFISTNHLLGGHVKDCWVDDVVISIQELKQLNLILK